MICKIVSFDENIPFGQAVSISLEDMSQADYLITDKMLDRNSCLFQEAERVEETDWILSIYEELKASNKVVIMNIDPNVELPGMKYDSNNEPEDFFGYWLVEGDDFFLRGFEGLDIRSVLYKVMYDMLIEEKIPFLEVKVVFRDSEPVYEVIQHFDSSSERIAEFHWFWTSDSKYHGNSTDSLENYINKYTGGLERGIRI